MSSNFDGYPIDMYQGGFSGSFDIPDEYGEGMAYEDVVAFVVVGTLSNAGVKTVRGDTVRVNKFKVGFARPLTVEEAEDVRKTMGWETIYGEQLDLFPPADKPKPVVSPPKAAPVKVSHMDDDDDDGIPAPARRAVDFDYEDDEDDDEYRPVKEVYVEPDHTEPIKYQDKALANFLYGGGQ